MTDATGWRLAIRHTSTYRYERDVVASYNEVRITPLTSGGQVTIDARIDVTPPARPQTYRDYWGTLVHTFDIHQAHRELVVVGTSLVETPARQPSLGPDTSAAVTWADLGQPAVTDLHHEYLRPTAVTGTGTDGKLDEIAATLRQEAPTPQTAVELVSDWVRGVLVYEKGTTNVCTSATDAWTAGSGVCQDFVHLAIALLRAMDIPARYASGYFHPDPDAALGTTIGGESHAWAEAWTGEWHPFDPTNDVAVAHRHVLVARGRDYLDITPLKGIITGAPAATPDVLVELTRQR